MFKPTKGGYTPTEAGARAAEEAIYTARIERAAIERKELKELFTEGLIPFALLGLAFNFTLSPVLGLCCILIHLISKRRKECKAKNTQ